ncbi:DinB family protein [Bacillus salacetis]|uniref:DinB family protein n=1 Tax=Bacillus salacetis TaxID=2315464 RepID=UPI003BA05D1A
MNFEMNEALAILERTPQTLEYFLTGLSDNWLLADEGEGAWNVSQVIDHLIEAERTNWIPRFETIIQDGENRVFPPFDRFAHLEHNTKTPLGQKFQLFKRIREENLSKIKKIVTSDAVLEMTGLHPAFGQVKGRELLSTWVVHDLTHISQIVRILAERYREDVGPWAEYLGILNKQQKN